MTNMVLECKEGGNFEPHPEGIHPAVCVGIMDLGLLEEEHNGERSLKPKLKLTFESEATTKAGARCTVSAKFTTSLHPKAKLTAFLGRWRGRAILPGDNVELGRLIGASCTLVISHRVSSSGRTYAQIDAVSKPGKQVVPSGTYDPVAAQQRYDDWRARSASPGVMTPTPSYPQPQPVPAPAMAVEPRPGSGVSPQTYDLPVGSGVSPQTNPNHGSAPTNAVAQPQPVPAPAREAEEDNVPFDPEVGF